MVEIILCAADALVSAVAFWFVLRLNLHMFQQNSYKPGEHRDWLLKNRAKQRVLYPVFLLQVLAGGVMHPVTAVLATLSSGICLFYYVTLSRQKAKKKLVFTDRVKRLCVTNVFLFVLLLLLSVLCQSLMFAFFSLGVLLLFEPVLLLFANFINAPVEKAVRNHYVKDAKRMLSERNDLTVIGLTGSYGKTSVKFYLNALLQTKYQVLMTPESYNTPMGVVKTIRTSLNPTHEIFLCEMGAKNIGDIKELCDIVHPKHGIITSIGPQHLFTFHSIENIMKTKFELADALPADGMLFLNGDNEYIRKQNKRSDASFYGLTENNGYRAGNLSVSTLGTTFTVTAPNNESAEFQTKLIGAHNVQNIVGAIAVAHALGISFEELKLPVRRLQPVPHRLQILPRGEVTIIDDAYNSNPIGSKAAVETLSMFPGLRILVTPGMVELGEKEKEYNFEFGKTAAGCCDVIALVGIKQTEPIAAGARAAGFPEEKLHAFRDLNEAMKYVYSLSTKEQKFILLENDLPDNYS